MRSTSRVRPAAADDVEAIVRVGHATWPSTYDFAGEAYVRHGLSTWWSEEAVRRSLTTTRNLVVEHDGEVVGMGNIDLRGDPAIIWKLYVLPGCQGSGAGHALIEALIEQVQPGTASVALEYVDGNTRAAAFYRRHGFTELRREPSTEPGWPDQVWMTRPIA